MKKIFALLSMLAFVGGMAFAQDTDSTLAPAADAPVMEFESTTIDYGTIEQNSDPLRTFIFTNTGTKPLQITHAKGSCGCTVPEWPKEAIFPGEQGKINVRYDTKRVGKFVKSVTLTTNEVAGTQKLTIKGNVLKKAEEPEGLPVAQPSILTPAGSN